MPDILAARHSKPTMHDVTPHAPRAPDCMPWQYCFLPIRQEAWRQAVRAYNTMYPAGYGKIEEITLPVSIENNWEGQGSFIWTLADHKQHYVTWAYKWPDIEPQALARYVPRLPRVSIPHTSAVWPDDVQLAAPRYARAR